MSTYATPRDGGKLNEEGLAHHLKQLLTSGIDLVDTPTSLAVTQRGAGANMSVDIAIGDCHVIRPDGTYSYWCWSDTATNATVSAASVVNPRIDVVAAWLDLSVTSSANSNNPGALKFMVVAGTPAGSPVAPSDATIQAAVGATSPFIKLAQIAVATSASNIVNANITDIRACLAFKGNLWGGSNNTKGHTVPNVADGTMVVSSDVGTVGPALLSTGAITLGYAQITSNFATTSSTVVQVIGLTVTVTIPAGGRKIRISAYTTSLYNSNANAAIITIWDGPVGTGTQIGQANVSSGVAGYNSFGEAKAVVTPSAGSRTYNIGFYFAGGGSSSGLGAATTGPAYILVEAI